MEPLAHLRQSPEAKIQKAIISMLESRGWTVMPTHGNLYQRGFPDLYAFNLMHGQRWIEVKNPSKFAFTLAQRKYFPMMLNAGIGVWVLVGATELEYQKLFQDPNVSIYMLKG